MFLLFNFGQGEFELMFELSNTFIFDFVFLIHQFFEGLILIVESLKSVFIEFDFSLIR